MQPLNSSAASPATSRPDGTKQSNHSKERRTSYTISTGPFRSTEQPPYLLLAGIICLVCWQRRHLYWFLKKRTRPAPPPVPPWEKALQDLAEARRLLSSGTGSFLYGPGQPDPAQLYRVTVCHQVDPTDHAGVSPRTGGQSAAARPCRCIKPNCSSASNRRIWPNSPTISQDMHSLEKMERR